MGFFTLRHYHTFKANKKAFYSLWIFLAIFIISLNAEFIANDKPLYIRYDNQNYFPIFKNYPETTFGGDFESEANYNDPYLRDLINQKGFLIMPLIPYSYDTIIYTLPSPAPTPPSLLNPLGTDDLGRDVVARLLYGLKTSILFAFILTFFSSIIGLVVGAICGYFGGKIDLFGQRLIEIWSGMPILFILIILASLLQPTFWTILFAVLLFSWITLVPFVRAEFLKVRNLDYIKAAKMLGVGHYRIIFYHILPNALVALLTYLPFILCGSITTLASLDFLGLGLPPPNASLGEILAQGKNNLNAPWLGLSGFFTLSILLCLLVFIGEGLRDCLKGNNETFRN
ncbi:ABC transporter permease [Helicobacter canadensis]|uniref:ABC-type transport system, permease component n=1 Tax=Helicobacter canadensis MIT 98-5491 TaxID=537970 RepID=C5ZZ05_9HELI|nr:ABC transporter permease [Helicobacter canadensis]EES89263.1 ABC-type transport system, permease component [Helicobacter canadensis MIT 98-5491]EFR48050.1 ABC transporter, permease protein [Helicobacter canadensis MIT 98-5491]STO99298.1 oligopeptide ABC transporter [Helicobacter canadensis]